jgi:uncharacterized membrane protein SpoIIM required for sporulation
VDAFVEQHRQRWERLKELLAAIDAGGLRALDAPALEEFGRLYRQVATHLAQARAERRDARVVEHLNLLVGRAHAIIYQRTRQRALRPWRFFATEFPQVFRRTFRFTGVSAILFVGSAVLAYLLVVSDSGWLEHVAPAGLADAIESFLKRGVPAGAYFSETQQALGGGPLSAFLWTHNLQIGLVAFALGIGVGVGTIWALVSNGMMVGSVIAVGVLNHKTALVCAIIAPHGVVELSSIMISGGAGLMLGYAVINPGDLARRDAIAIAARDAVKLMLGVAPLFLIAGLIEGTISPISDGPFASDAARLVFGAATGILLAGYLVLGDRLLGRLSLRRRPGAQTAQARPTPSASLSTPGTG